jgi:hypothetical protein
MFASNPEEEEATSGTTNLQRKDDEEASENTKRNEVRSSHLGLGLDGEEVHTCVIDRSPVPEPEKKHERTQQMTASGGGAWKMHTNSHASPVK